MSIFSKPTGLSTPVRDLLSIKKSGSTVYTVLPSINSNVSLPLYPAILLHYNNSKYPIAVIVPDYSNSNSPRIEEYATINLNEELERLGVSFSDGYYYAHAVTFIGTTTDDLTLSSLTNNGFHLGIDQRVVVFNKEIATELDYTVQDIFDASNNGNEYLGGVEFLVYNNLQKEIDKEVALKSISSKCFDNCDLIYKLNTVKFLEDKKAFVPAHEILNS